MFPALRRVDKLITRFPKIADRGVAASFAVGVDDKDSHSWIFAVCVWICFSLASQTDMLGGVRLIRQFASFADLLWWGHVNEGSLTDLPCTHLILNGSTAVELEES